MQLRVVRSGLVEAVHAGAVAAVRPDGSLIFSSGEVDEVFFLRSAAKPFQAASTLALIDPVDPELLAVMSASHDGLPVHVALVEQILALGGLDATHLATPPSWPTSRVERHRQIAAGCSGPRPIWHNCSGKHAGMLLACVRQGWPIESYAHPEHPLQLAIRDQMLELFGPATLPVGVDGCGVPVFRGTVRGLAVAFASFMRDDRNTAVIEAMGRFPVLVSGPGNADSEIATGLGGIAKRGAEGCLVVGLPEQGAMALKIWDGAERAVAASALAGLDHAGWIPTGPRKNLESALARPVFGGGESVGHIEAVLEMENT